MLLTMSRPFIVVLIFITFIALAISGCATARSDNATAKSAIVNKTVIPSKPAAGAAAPAPPPPAPRSNAPVINTFTSNPTIISDGSASRLTWDVANATSLTMTPLLGAVDHIGTLTVFPKNSTIYRLTAANAHGTTTATATIFVAPRKTPLLPIIISFSAHPHVLSQPGNTCTLDWNVFGANTITLNTGTTSLAPIGTVQVIPQEPTSSSTAANENYTPTQSIATTGPYSRSYTLTATNYYGTSTATITVTTLGTTTIQVVESLDPNDKRLVQASTVMPKIDRFLASPNTVLPGNPTTIFWDGVSQSSLTTLNGEMVGPSGSRKIYPASAVTYTLVASNSYGTCSVSVPVTVLSYTDLWFKPLVQ